MRFLNLPLLGLAAGLLASSLPATAQTPPYRFIRKISLPGDGKWDFLKMDGERERLYVSHGDRVQVIDLNTNKLIGEITGLSGVHGIALDKEHDKAYITNGTANTVSVANCTSFQVVKTIPCKGKKPDAILFDKFSQRVFAFNNGSGDAEVIDVKTDDVVGRLKLGGAPEFAISNEKGTAYNNNEETNEVVAFDPKTLVVKNRFPLAPNKVPTGLGIDVPNNRLFATCRDSKTLVVLDASTGRIVQTLPIGGGVDGVIYEKELKLVITSNGDGTLSIIHQDSPDKYSLVQTLKTGPGQKTIIHRGTTHYVFLSGADTKPGTNEPIPGTFGVYVYGPDALVK